MGVATEISWRWFAGFLAVWLVLTGAAVKDLPTGLLAAFVAAAVHRRVSGRRQIRIRLRRLIGQLPHFVYRSIAGGIDVARRAFAPSMPLKPGWIRYSVHLPPGAPRVLLGGELSLQPGTLVAGSDHGDLLVHCLDVDLPISRIIADEESRLQRAVEP